MIRSIRMLAIRLPADIELRLEALAQATGRTKTYYAREAILKHLEDLEDLYLAEKELIEVRAGRSKTMSLKDVMTQHGLAD
jgi:RHH-type transcriptional regulator, rel operon repressor / antitoxin RelB